MSEVLLTSQKEVEMACRLVIALNVKRIRDGLQKAWLTHYEARSIVLAKFKSGAVRPFIEKLKRADIFEYFTKPEGGRNDKVFRFTPDAEQRILGELKPLADLLFQIFPEQRGS